MKLKRIDVVNEVERESVYVEGESGEKRFPRTGERGGDKSGGSNTGKVITQIIRLEDELIFVYR